MLVSIIIPIYKVENYIEKSLLSALNQTYPNIEIILINDCTPDNSMTIVESILIKHIRSSSVRIINHKSNRGLSSARNTGIVEAAGDYLFFLDSDDWLALDCIAKQVAIAIKYNVEMVIGDVEVVGNINAFNKWWNFKKLPVYIDKNETIKSYYFSNQLYMMAWNKLIKRSFLVENELYFKEGILHEDDLWMFNLILVINTLCTIDSPTYYYLQRPGSIISTREAISLQSRYLIGKDMFESLKEEVDRKTLIYILNYSFVLIWKGVFNPELLIETVEYRNQIRKKIKHCPIIDFNWNKSVLFLLAHYLPFFGLRYYFRILGKLQQYKLVNLSLDNYFIQ